jgi:hypothetical protein
MRFLKLPELRDYRNKLTKHPKLKYANRQISEIKQMALHHGATRTGSPEVYANYHVNTLGWPGVAYPFIIGKNGVIYWCHDLTKITYHVGNHNRYVLGINMIGDFRYEAPTAAQYQSLYRLLEALKVDLELTESDILGHQEYAGYEWKQCPALNMDQLRGQLAAKTYQSVQYNFNNDKKIHIKLPLPVKLTKEDDGGMSNRLFQPSSSAIKKSVTNVLTRLSNSKVQGDKALAESWKVKAESDELTESDAVGLLYVALDRELETKKL